MKANRVKPAMGEDTLRSWRKSPSVEGLELREIGDETMAGTAAIRLADLIEAARHHALPYSQRIQFLT
jgi:hypothetical protein